MCIMVFAKMAMLLNIVIRSRSGMIDCDGCGKFRRWFLGNWSWVIDSAIEMITGIFEELSIDGMNFMNSVRRNLGREFIEKDFVGKCSLLRLRGKLCFTLSIICIQDVGKKVVICTSILVICISGRIVSLTDLKKFSTQLNCATNFSNK